MRRLVAFAALSAALVLAAIALFWMAYGTPFPLAFYVKTLHFADYGADFVASTRTWKLRYLVTFLFFAAPLVWLGLRGASKGLLLAAAAFVAYHAFTTGEVMGYHARFSVPALIPLALAALRATPALERSPLPARDLGVFLAAWTACGAVLYARHALLTAPDGIGGAEYALFVALAAGCFWLSRGERRTAPAALLGAALAVALLAVHRPVRPPPLADSDYVARAVSSHTVTRGLPELARCLGPQLHVYHSEIGAAGLALPDATITDLSGVMNPELALGRARVEEICVRDRPDAVYLPHRAYTALNREIAAGHCLDDYTRVISDSASPLYVRRDHAARWFACAGSATSDSP